MEEASQETKVDNERFTKLVRQHTDEKFNELQQMPSEEFGHKSSLLHTLEIKNANDLSKIVNKELALGNIDDDNFISLINMSMNMYILPTYFLWERTQEKGIKDLLDWFLASLLAQIKTSRSKGGMGLLLQHGAMSVGLERKAKKNLGYKMKPQEQMQEEELYD